MIAAAPLILLPFGQDDVRQSSSVLRRLACGSVFYAALALVACAVAPSLVRFLRGRTPLELEIHSNRPAPETVAVR